MARFRARNGAGAEQLVALTLAGGLANTQKRAEVHNALTGTALNRPLRRLLARRAREKSCN